MTWIDRILRNYFDAKSQIRSLRDERFPVGKRFVLRGETVVITKHLPSPEYVVVESVDGREGSWQTVRLDELEEEKT